MKKIILLIIPIITLSLFSCEKNSLLCKEERDMYYHVNDKSCDRSATESQFLSDWTFTRTIGSTAGEYLIRVQSAASEYTAKMVTTFGRPEVDFANNFELFIKQNTASTASGSFTLNEVNFSTEISNFKFETSTPSTATISYTMNDTNYVDYGSRDIPN